MTFDNPQDLLDDEWVQLDQALSMLHPHQIDVSWLDGYLAGISLQPQPPSEAVWLSTALGSIAPDHPITRLCRQRHQALRAALRSQAWWDPFIRAEPDQALPLTAEQISDALAPWVAGLEQSLYDFSLPQVEANPAWMMVLARLYRHLSANDDQDREVIALLNEAHPLSTLEDAVDELTACVGELWDLVPHPV